MLNAQGNPVTILIIADDPIIVELVEKTFGNAGYHILSAFNAENGLVLAAEKKPDLILLDVTLPDVNGFVVLEKLKGNPVTEGISVVMLTAKRLDENVQLGLDLGAEDYISKPVHVGLLVKRVENVLKKIIEGE